MPRSPFALTDDQARIVSNRVAELQATYPFDQRNHRPFVRGFMRAVHDATGKLHSPAIYQRLLAAYARERRPSTATLAVEKEALAAELAARPGLPAMAGEERSPTPVLDFTQVHAIVSDAVDAALARASRFGANVTAQTEFYAARLRETELELLAVRAEAARLAAELAVARESVSLREQEAGLLQESLANQATAVTKLTNEVTDIRKFALQSIDEARGESRVWKERAVALEAQRQMDARLLETFRQHAYRAGAAIPDVLRQEKTR
ncbi:hypothetical protein ABT364_05345 [Massilia sp. SR12]